MLLVTMKSGDFVAAHSRAPGNSRRFYEVRTRNSLVRKPFENT